MAGCSSVSYPVLIPLLLWSQFLPQQYKITSCVTDKRTSAGLTKQFCLIWVFLQFIINMLHRKTTDWHVFTSSVFVFFCLPSLKPRSSIFVFCLLCSGENCMHWMCDRMTNKKNTIQTNCLGKEHSTTDVSLCAVSILHHCAMWQCHCVFAQCGGFSKRRVPFAIVHYTRVV